MSNYYKKKHLQATKNKIYSLKKQTAFFKRNIWSVLIFGIITSFLAPNYSGSTISHKRKSALEISGLSYWELVLLAMVTYALIALLGHLIWSFQDKKELKRLTQLKELLEKELNINAH